MKIFYYFLNNKYIAIPLFVAIMGLIFTLTFYSVGAFLHNSFAELINFTTSVIENLILKAGASPVIRSLIVDGICTGIGSVLSFLPTIAILFSFLYFLEESGYMSFAAASMKGVMSKLGLPGEAVTPLLIGFGCSVPAIMAASSIKSRKSRNLTILLIPFMSCSAKIPIYSIFVSVFFPSHKILAMTCIYVFGILVAMCYAIVLRNAFFCVPQCYISAIPSACRLPSAKKVFRRIIMSISEFIKKAFTIIFLASILTWFLQSFDTSMNLTDTLDNSILAFLGKASAPLFEPLGFGDWRIAAAILAGLMAKEAVVSTLAVIAAGYSGVSIGCLLPEIFSPQTAFFFMVFCLLYVPCIPTMAAIKKETGSFIFVALASTVQFILAWFLCFIFNIIIS